MTSEETIEEITEEISIPKEDTSLEEDEEEEFLTAEQTEQDKDIVDMIANQEKDND